MRGLSSVSAVAAGYDHNLALKSDGTVWAWGGNVVKPTWRWEKEKRQPLSSRSSEGSRFGGRHIAGGNHRSIALKSDGTVWAIGDGLTHSRTPEQVQGFGEQSPPETPQWPEGDVLTVTDVTYNSVQLNWQSATDETGVDKYLVYQDNTLLATLNGDVNSYEVKGLSPSSSYLFFIGRRRCRWQSKCEKRSDGHYCSIYGSRLFSAFRFQNLFIRRIQL